MAVSPDEPQPDQAPPSPTRYRRALTACPAIRAHDYANARSTPTPTLAPLELETTRPLRDSHRGLEDGPGARRSHLSRTVAGAGQCVLCRHSDRAVRGVSSLKVIVRRARIPRLAGIRCWWLDVAPPDAMPGTHVGGRPGLARPWWALIPLAGCAWLCAPRVLGLAVVDRAGDRPSRPIWAALGVDAFMTWQSHRLMIGTVRTITAGSAAAIALVRRRVDRS